MRNSKFVFALSAIAATLYVCAIFAFEGGLQAYLFTIRVWMVLNNTFPPCLGLFATMRTLFDTRCY